MIGVVADPELAPDHRRHALGGPDFAAEAECLGAPRQQGRQPVPLLGGQLGRRPRRHAPPQRLDPALAGTSHPLAHGARRHPECVGDRPLAPALPLQFPGAQPAAFAPLHRWLRLRLHASRRRTDRANFSPSCGDQ